MSLSHADALVQLLDETARRYVDHQEDDLGHPVLKREFFWGITRHFLTTLVAFAADEAEPTTVVEAVLQQVRARALMLLERWQEAPDEDELPDDDQASEEEDDDHT
jgi:hypothetical protein